VYRFFVFDIIRETGLEGEAVVNDTTVWCQSRGVTEPAGETKSRFSFSVFLHFHLNEWLLDKEKEICYTELTATECKKEIP